jgi:hypothetical protein
MFTSSKLTYRHEHLHRVSGVESEYPDYVPHISLTAEQVDLTSVTPYRGRIILGPEIFEEVKEMAG